jgi:hypothetical protein
MDALDLHYLQYSAAGWALWKALDHLMLRYFPGWWPESHNGHGAAAARQARLAEITASEEFAAACRELADTSSPLMRALAEVWAASSDGGGDAQAIERALADLSAEQALVVLAVLARAAG